jgi:hypothetical protein
MLFCPYLQVKPAKRKGKTAAERELDELKKAEAEMAATEARKKAKMV